jgi:hypothetical protein
MERARSQRHIVPGLCMADTGSRFTPSSKRSLGPALVRAPEAGVVEFFELPGCGKPSVAMRPPIPGEDNAGRGAARGRQDFDGERRMRRCGRLAGALRAQTRDGRWGGHTTGAADSNCAGRTKCGDNRADQQI